MSRYAVVGATGGTGRPVVEELLSPWRRGGALGRNRRALDFPRAAGAEPVALDLATASTDELAAAFAGSDGILFVAGSTDPWSVGAVDRDGSIRSVSAAERVGVRRFVQISSIGAGDRIPAEIDTPQFAPYYVAKRAADAQLRASSLDWTIIEPGWPSTAQRPG